MPFLEEYSMWQPFRDYDYNPNLRFRMNMGGIQDPTRHVLSSAVGDHRFHLGGSTTPGFTRYD